MGGVFGGKGASARGECGYRAGEGELGGGVAINLIRNLRRGGGWGDRVKSGRIKSNDWPRGGTV